MSLHDRIKALKIAAMKAKNGSAEGLAWVQGEVEQKARKVKNGVTEFADEDVIPALMSVKKKLEDAKDDITLDNIKELLPEQMSSEEIRNIFADNKENLKTMGEKMAFLKRNYLGRFDGKEASKIAREE